MSRYKAFAIHLGISLAIFLVLLALIVFVWYPQPYFAADGGWQGIRLIAGVDLVLGPLLTLIVYKAGKRGLRFDLALIGLAQASALAVGIHLVHDQRTAMVVYADGAFYSLNSDQIHDAGERASALQRAAVRAPAYAYVQLPEDKKAALDVKMRIFKDARPLYLRGELYEPLDARALPAVIARGADVQALTQARTEEQVVLARFLAEQKQAAEAFVFVPLYCRYRDTLLVLNKRDGRIVDALDIQPPPLP
jgi:hypothetical protein